MAKNREDKIDVLVKPDPGLTYPELWLSVYIADDDESEVRAFAEWLVRTRSYKANSIDKADLVIFTGGPDVDPALYGSLFHPATSVSPERDKKDLEIYHQCYEEGVPMLGICRGAQFLAVMNGAKLYQDVDGHYQAHGIWDSIRKTFVANVSSVHHQMAIPHEGMEIIATASKSGNTKWFDGNNFTNKGPEPEVFFYRDTVCLGIQGHPEYRGYPEFAQYSAKLMEDYFLHNPDLTNKNGLLRIKDELIQTRKKRDEKIVPINNKGKN